jgi:D-tyrosyl-tRNA(Tyr) deacylase
MKAVIQRVSRAHVSVGHHTIGKIEAGLLVLLGITQSDNPVQTKWLAEKIANLRIFSDAEGKMNLSVKDLQLGVLVISQFTLYGNCIGGRRPDFMQAARPEHAEPLYNDFVHKMAHVLGYPVQTGSFGASMQVHLVNNGPVTLIIDTATRDAQN